MLQRVSSDCLQRATQVSINTIADMRCKIPLACHLRVDMKLQEWLEKHGFAQSLMNGLNAFELFNHAIADHTALYKNVEITQPGTLLKVVMLFLDDTSAMHMMTIFQSLLSFSVPLIWILTVDVFSNSDLDLLSAWSSGSTAGASLDHHGDPGQAMKKVPGEDHKEEPNGAGFFFCHRQMQSGQPVAAVVDKFVHPLIVKQVGQMPRHQWAL
ncbi:unnamed protein product [Sphagnum jensenii]